LQLDWTGRFTLLEKPFEGKDLPLDWADARERVRI
jgi:hypothetical protein